MVGITALSLLATTVLSLQPVTIEGNAFYNGSDTRFYIRGVDYQPGGSSNLTDPLADPNTCKRDISHFVDLGVNAIRVYTVDNSADHDECMAALDDAGIYLLLDVNTPKQSLNRLNNETLQLSYNTGYLQHVFATIDAFKSYDNVLGFFAANEVINSENTTNSAPYIKAVVRDMKQYIKAQANRTIPVAYSAADIVESRWEQMCYFNCGNESERIDMFGMNDYSWCGTQSSFTISGWAQNVQAYSNYSIPMFLSEYGCNKVVPRTFPEVHSLYSTDMSPVYSGGLVYEYSNEANNYGLVDINGDNVSERQDYSNFKSALANAPNPTGSAGASTTRQPAQCPDVKPGTWDVNPNEPLPAMPKNAEIYMKRGAGKPLGLNGPDTQSGSDLDKPVSSSAVASSSAKPSSSAASSRSSSKASSSKVSSPSEASSSKASSSRSASLSSPASSTALAASTANGGSESSSGSSLSGSATGANGAAADATKSSSSSKKKKNGAVTIDTNLNVGLLAILVAAAAYM